MIQIFFLQSHEICRYSAVITRKLKMNVLYHIYFCNSSLLSASVIGSAVFSSVKPVFLALVVLMVALRGLMPQVLNVTNFICAVHDRSTV